MVHLRLRRSKCPNKLVPTESNLTSITETASAGPVESPEGWIDDVVIEEIRRLLASSHETSYHTSWILKQEERS